MNPTVSPVCSTSGSVLGSDCIPTELGNFLPRTYYTVLRKDLTGWISATREFLSSQDLDSSEVVIGHFFNYDVDLYMTYLLASGGRVLRLIVQYLFRRPLDGPVELVGTKVWNWEDVAPSDPHWNDPMIAAGRRVLQEEMSA
jgi:hypothetical protein